MLQWLSISKCERPFLQEAQDSPSLFLCGIHIPWNRRILLLEFRAEAKSLALNFMAGFRGWQNRWSSSTTNF
jgi:hypothetical protein